MHLHEASSPAFYVSGTPKMPDKTDLSDLPSCLGQLIFSYYTPSLSCCFRWILKMLFKCKPVLLSMFSLMSNIGREDLFYALSCCIGVDLPDMTLFDVMCNSLRILRCHPHLEKASTGVY